MFFAFFAFRDTNRDNLVFLRPETRDVATRVSGRKWVQSTELDIVNGSFCNLCALALWLALHVFATQCWRAPRRAKQLSTVAIPLYRFLSCWCLETVFHLVSALQSVVFNWVPLLYRQNWPGGGGYFLHNRIIGMCRWMTLHFHDLIDYHGVAFSLESE